jgi:HK97 family phage portal protein
VRQPFSYQAAVLANRSWIYAAAHLNAQAVASQPLRLYVRSRGTAVKLWKTARPSRSTFARFAGERDDRPSPFVMQKAAEFGDDYEVVTEAHPVLTLLDQPNSYTNGYEATMLRVLFQELTGNAYLHPVIDAQTGVPVELWSMPSQYVEIVPGKTQFIDAYLYGASRDQRRIFAADEVIHFKRPNPGDLYYGLGKLEAAWGAATMNAAVKDMDLSFFQNKARPDYLLTIKSNASQEEIERLEVQIDEKLRGKERTGRFLTATADIDLKPMNFPPKDLGGREDIVEEIAAVFGVPVSMLKANDPNLASATVGFQSWKAISVLPLLRLDEQTLNSQLLPLFGIEDDAFLAYDSPVVEDEKFEFEKRRSSVAAGIITANEARKLEGLEPVSDEMADRLLINGQPLGGPAPAAPALPFGASIQTDTPDPAPQPERKDALGDCVSEKIPTLIAEGYEQDQAVAIAYSMCSEGKTLEDILDERGSEMRSKALSDIDTKPPQTVADNARRALEVRARKPESQRGMTAVGIARARDLANRVELSEDTIRRMLAYFERHEVDKQGETWDDQGKGWQAWNGWGGDDGFAWARRKVEQFDRERERKAAGKSAKNGGGDPPAKPSERISGSDRNPEGSASGSRGGIEISEETEEALRNKVDEHNDKHGDENGKRVDLGMLKAVYRRGAGAFSTSHRAGVGREQWAMARVNAFLTLVRRGKPEDADYTTDFDLLPSGHPKKSDGKKSCGCCGDKPARVSTKRLWSDLITKASERDAEREFDKITEQEQEIGKAVSKVLEKQVAEVIAAIRKEGRPTRATVQKVEKILRESRWNAELVNALRPYLADAIAGGVELGLDTVGKMVTGAPDFTPARDDLRAYAQSESVRLARTAAAGVNRYTSVRVGEILGDGIADGETIDQLASRVQDWAGEKGDADRATRNRAVTIARTEAQRATRKAELEAWKSTGIVEGKTWLLAPDPCEFCEAAAKAFESKAVGLDDSFYQKGETLEGADGGALVLDYEAIDAPPLHPNCRCSMEPKLAGEYGAIQDEINAEVDEYFEQLKREQQA